MRYHDYMNEFTVIDETKSLLFSRMKQRARQLKAAQVKRERTASAAAAMPKKTNTFKLHPKRWIAIATSVALVIAAIPTVYYTAFNKPGGPNLASVKLEYMENMMVDVDGVTAYSIRQETEDGTASPASLQSSSKSEGPALSLLSASVIKEPSGAQPFDKKESKRNYLYSTNESYELGNVEYDESGITKVSFMKNKEVTEDIYDDNGKLIDSNRKITQEELDSQINKIYTTKEYTFIQFVPLVEKSGWYGCKTADGKTTSEFVLLRPDGMKYDEQGVADFDRAECTATIGETELRAWSYYTSALSASFVIDNATGYIYKIENFHVDGFYNGMLISYANYEGTDIMNREKPYYYSIGTDENHNLVFTDVLPNKDVDVYDVFIDNYGWLFVLNNRVDDVDRDRKIIYTTNRYKYVYDSDNKVYVTNGNRGGGFLREALTIDITKRIISGEEADLEPDVILRDLKYFRSTPWDSYTNLLSGIYENLYVFKYPECRETDIPEYDECMVDYIVAYDKETESGLALAEGIVAYEYAMESYTGVRWLNSNYDILVRIKDNKLSYASVNLDDCKTEFKTLGEDDFISLRDETLYEAEDYYMTVGNDKYKVNDVYYYTDVNNTYYYHLVRTTTGVELVELTSKSYTDNVFIFQPINK